MTSEPIFDQVVFGDAFRLAYKDQRVRPRYDAGALILNRRARGPVHTRYTETPIYDGLVHERNERCPECSRGYGACLHSESDCDCCWCGREGRDG